jgi:hypothetical protein
MSETAQIKTSIRNLSPEDRKRYYRENKRKSRLKSRKCSCGEPGFAVVMATKEIKCARHFVPLVKAEIIRLQQKEAPT